MDSQITWRVGLALALVWISNETMSALGQEIVQVQKVAQGQELVLSAEDPSIRILDDNSSTTSLIPASEYVVPESEMVIEEIVLEPTETVVVADAEDTDVVRFGDWLGYNSVESDTTWVVGHGDDLGIFSMQSFPTLEVGEDKTLSFGTSIHWVDGPIATDLPPRLYDLHLAYHARTVWSDSFIFDVRAGVGAFTDFEGSVRKGIRFPGHVVSYYQWHPWFVTLLGAEAYDRDDVSVLPVAGFRLAAPRGFGLRDRFSAAEDSGPNQEWPRGLLGR